jgi:hypothetical protein
VAAKLTVKSAAEATTLSLSIVPGGEGYGSLNIDMTIDDGMSVFGGIFNVSVAKRIRDFLNEHLVEEVATQKVTVLR